jgi:hypothetical protein
MLSKEELIEMGKEARKERDILLREHPELIEFQREIDRCLENAGDSENRMAVLAVMIEAKLKELQDELLHLSFLMRKIKTPKYLPDIQKGLFSE